MTWDKLITLVFCFVLALVVALYFVPVMRKAAIKWGVVDKPDGRLKTQREPVAYLGGIGVYVAFLLALSFVFEFSPQVLGLLLGGTIMLVIGLVDDFGVLLPYQKLAGQALATFVLIKAGIYIKIEFLPIWVTIPMTFLWMLGVINAVNIIDIMDGLSSGVAFIVCLALLAVSLINLNLTIAMLTVALAGSLLGFLIYNFHPAKIYLGDSGSLFIGLMLGALAMIGDYSSHNTLAYVTPIFFLGVPIFDTLFVMVIRSRKGISPFLGSPDHFAIRLRKRGLSVRQVVILCYIITAILAISGILNIYFSHMYTLAAVGVLFLAATIIGWWLSRIET